MVAAAAPVAAIIPPPPDIQPVIDKLAEYVARNGVKFETSVRAKNDPRYAIMLLLVTVIPTDTTVSLLQLNYCNM